MFQHIFSYRCYRRCARARLRAATDEEDHDLFALAASADAARLRAATRRQLRRGAIGGNEQAPACCGWSGTKSTFVCATTETY